MPRPAANSAIAQNLARLTVRIDRLEGLLRQLRVETLHPTFYCPSRQDMEALAERVRALEAAARRD